MASLTHETIKKYKIIPEKNNLKRVEVDDNPYKTVVANKVTLYKLGNANFPDDIYMEVFRTDHWGTEVTIYDPINERK